MIIFAYLRVSYLAQDADIKENSCPELPEHSFSGAFVLPEHQLCLGKQRSWEDQFDGCYLVPVDD